MKELTGLQDFVDEQDRMRTASTSIFIQSIHEIL
jgi:hypothetical protein